MEKIQFTTSVNGEPEIGHYTIDGKLVNVYFPPLNPNESIPIESICLPNVLTPDT